MTVLFREAPYQQATLSLEPRDILVGCTDGISEAMNLAEEEWGEERFLPTVMAAADRFTGGASQHDDMTLVVLKFGVPGDYALAD